MLVSMLTFGLVGAAQAQEEDLALRTAANSAVGDFDGDGIADGVYGDSASGASSSCPGGYGAVLVHYGAAPTVGVRLSRGGGLEGSATCSAALGAAVATGDLDGDGYDDLAIGLTGLSYGQVQVVYGSRSGLSNRQATLTGPTADGVAAHFGAALASGDFNCDGYDDLAVGAPDADLGSTSDGGAVSVYAGRAGGVATVGARTLQSALGDAVEAGDRFGFALAVGDLDGMAGTCGCDDLVIAAPDEDWAGVADAGLIHVAYGGIRGIGSGGVGRVAPTGVLGPVRAQRLGENLAVGDVDLDGVDDLTLTLKGTDTLAWLPGGPAGLGPVSIVSDSLSVEPSCGPEAVQGKVKIIIHSITFGPSDCEPCCGEGACCIGGSCGG